MIVKVKQLVVKIVLPVYSKVMIKGRKLTQDRDAEPAKRATSWLPSFLSRNTPEQQPTGEKQLQVTHSGTSSSSAHPHNSSETRSPAAQTHDSKSEVTRAPNPQK
jgi:hypothetical protein